MSVIDSFVGRINSVQTDISTSIKHIGARTKKKVISAAPHLDGVNLDVGADILQTYQESWAKYSKATRENAKRFEEVDRAIQTEYGKMKAQHASIMALTNLVRELPQITESINGVVLRLGTLESDIGEIESQLILLEDLCDQQDAENNKVHHQQQLSMYQQRKNLEIEQLKLTLAQEHAAKVAMYESRLQTNLREKQAALDDKYSSEIQHYKEFGTTHLKPSVTAPQIDVSEITLDEDRGDLDSFLNIECSTPSTADTESSSVVVDGEEDSDGDDEEAEGEEDGPESNHAVIIGTPPVEIKQDEDIDIASLSLADHDAKEASNADSVQDSDPESVQKSHKSDESTKQDPEPSTQAS